MLGFFSPTPSHCEECCYKHSSTIFHLNSCFLFFGVYAQERNCWVTWYISVYNLPWDHQVSSTAAVPFTISLPATYENPNFSTSMPKSVCFFLFLNNFLFIGCSAQILILSQGLKLHPLQWKHGISTIGPPGKSPKPAIICFVIFIIATPGRCLSLQFY